MNNTMIWIVVAVIILAAGAFFLFQGTGSMTPTPTPTPPPGSITPPEAGTPPPSSAPMVAAVSYSSADGFVPAEVTIKRGGTVSWTNTGSDNMWVATAPHPAHTSYSGTALAQHCPDTSKTAFDQCANGPTFTFKFDKVGTWPYHNHSNATKFGRVIVVE